MIRSQKRSDGPERPVTFNAAENLGPFELAQLWADCTAWPIDERTPYDERAELACISALAQWLKRWQPIAIHGAVLAGARPEAVAGALGASLQVAFERWHEWAVRQRDFIIGGKPGITEDKYNAVARRLLPSALGCPDQTARLRAALTYGATPAQCERTTKGIDRNCRSRS
jgi:hypothetical protein